MADALNEEWWIQTNEEDGDENSEQNTSKTVKEVITPEAVEEKGKRGLKRKADGPKSKDKKNKKKKKKESGNEKKRERKRITDESDETLNQPGDASGVRTMMIKVLKDRLGEAALEDILPDSENDFYPNNADSIEPSKYLTSILTNWRATLKKSLFMKKTGSPSVLIVTSSAIRAVELNRQIKDFIDGKCKVAKLFAKHMKVEDQKKFLSKTNCQIGIGTPGRIHLLVKQGALQLESLTAVVLDWNWRDTKFKRMADIPEIRQDLVTLLKDFIIETIQGSSCKLALL